MCLAHAHCCSLVVVDEVEALATGHSEVLHTLFNWAGAANTKLLLITISNSFDLISRSLSLVQGMPHQVAFETYTVEQIAAIIQKRVESSATDGAEDERLGHVFEPAAVEFLARKVAKSSGDLRKCLDLCSRAVARAAARKCSCGLGAEATERDAPTADSHWVACKGGWDGAAVDFSEMASVVREGMSSHVVDAIANLPQHCKLVLYAALQQAKESRARMSVVALQNAYSAFCRARKLPATPSSQFSDLLSWLASSGLIHTVRLPRCSSVPHIAYPVAFLRVSCRR